MSLQKLLCLTFISFLTVSSYTQNITVIEHNSESGGANPAVIAEWIPGIEGCEIWGICEIQDDTWAQTFDAAAEDGEGSVFVRILGMTSGADKMAIVYDSDRFAQVGDFVDQRGIKLKRCQYGY